MSDEKIDALLARIAKLESERATPAPAAPAAPAFDPRQFRAAFIANPIGVLAQMGVPVQAIAPHIVAHQLGDAAPPELRAMVSGSHAMAATDALASEVAQLAQWRKSQEDEARRAGLAQSFKTISADKIKYPHLSAALVAQPALFDDDVKAHQGDAAALAAKVEARLAALHSVFTPPPASSENAAAQSTTSEQVRAQGISAADIAAGNPPPLPKASISGAPTELDLQALRDEVVKAAEAGKYNGR